VLDLSVGHQHPQKPGPQLGGVRLGGRGWGDGPRSSAVDRSQQSLRFLNVELALSQHIQYLTAFFVHCVLSNL
jgi:hypothetical protein